MGHPDLLPDRIITRKGVEDRREVVAAEGVDAPGWDLCLDVLKGGLAEADWPHERRVARSAAA